MFNRGRLVPVASIATLVLLVAVGGAAARRIEFTNAEAGYEAVWPSTSRLSITEGNGSGAILCPVTLEGQFHSIPISKVSGLLIGYITSARVGAASSCQGGSFVALTETLPWHVRYDSFTGTLPSIMTIKLQFIGMSIEVRPTSGLRCLLATTAARPGRFIANTTTGPGTVTSFRADEAALISLTGEFGCGVLSARLSGSGDMLEATTTTKITTRLVA
jgi:hypothetical protein